MMAMMKTAPPTAYKKSLGGVLRISETAFCAASRTWTLALSSSGFLKMTWGSGSATSGCCCALGGGAGGATNSAFSGGISLRSEKLRRALAAGLFSSSALMGSTVKPDFGASAVATPAAEAVIFGREGADGAGAGSAGDAGETAALGAADELNPLEVGPLAAEFGAAGDAPAAAALAFCGFALEARLFDDLHCSRSPTNSLPD